MVNLNSTKKELETEIGEEETERAKREAAFEYLKEKYRKEV